MAWDPKQHPRDPLGRWRKKDLGPGWHNYTVGGEVRRYYINEMGDMANGSTILHMAARNNVKSKVSGEPSPCSRIHIMDSGDGDQLAVAASTMSTFGVVNHNREAPPEVFSYNQQHDFLPVHNNVGETNFGGVAMPMTNKPGTPDSQSLVTLAGRGYTPDYGNEYQTMDATDAAKLNEEIFSSGETKTYTASPEKFAEQMVEVRSQYREMGLTEGQARNQNVYVYVNKKGALIIQPALRKDKNGKIVKRRSPNTHGGSPSVLLHGAEVTRMTRAMQSEGIDEVQFAISSGSKNPNSDGQRQHALHFRKEGYVNERSGDETTMWGTIERVNYGYKQGTPTELGIEPMSTDEYTKSINMSASHYYHPKTDLDAVKLMGRKYNNKRNRYLQRDIDMKSGTTSRGKDYEFTWRDRKTGIRYEVDGEGGFVGWHAETVGAFRKLNRWLPKSDANKLVDIEQLGDDFMVSVTDRRTGEKGRYRFSSEGMPIKR